MNPNLTDITLVLDRSGSMQSVADDTIGGVNRFIADQIAVPLPSTANLTLNQFDDVFEHVFYALSIQAAQPLTKATFQPRGSTALLDAIGRSIEETGERIGKMTENERPGKVVFVIVTDGYENASRKFSSQQISDMITHQRDVYKWEFVFLAADQDAIASAGRIGIIGTHAMTYAKSGPGTSKGFGAVSSNLRAMRCAEKQDMSYTTAQRDEQTEEGV